MVVVLCGSGGYIYIYTTCTVLTTCACLVVPSGSLPVLSRSVVSYLYHFLQCCNMYMQQLHTHSVSRDRKLVHTYTSQECTVQWHTPTHTHTCTHVPLTHSYPQHPPAFISTNIHHTHTHTHAHARTHTRAHTYTQYTCTHHAHSNVNHFLQCCNMYMQQLHTQRSKQGAQAYQKAGVPLSYCRSMAFRLSVQ